jgi:diguanylate cyclase (GGDEF)-like protein
MSLELVLVGYALCAIAVATGCSAIVRSGHGSQKLIWLIAGIGCVLAALLLYAGRPFLPRLFTIVLANEAVLLAFVLFHQCVAAILESSRRYLGASMMLLGAQLILYLHFTYTVPDLRARIIIRSVALSIQGAFTVSILLHDRARMLRHARRLVLGTSAAFLLLEISRIAATAIWPPAYSTTQLDPVQALYASLGFALGLAEAVAIIWLGMAAQRDRLQIMATTDSLSGLMNRRAFDQVLKRELAYAERRNEPVALLMIDIDHFKEINDMFGHQMGDEVIRRISRLLSINTRTMDAVARYGGEEFAMILRGMQSAQAQSIAERLRTQIEAMAGLPDPLRVTASIGITVACPGDTVASVLKRSDRALYASKHTGRNRVCTQLACSES